MKKGIDLATIIGFVLAPVCLLISVFMEGGSPMAYFSPSAMILVFGGSIGVAFITHPLPVVLKLPKYVMKGLFEVKHDASAVVEEFVRLAERARREGLLALEQEAATISDPLIKKGIMLVVDGTDPEVVKSVLEIEIEAREQRHEVGIGMFEAMGGFAPTLGIIGTVMGLVTILAHMNKASELGHSIATAFIATLYGVSSANLFWLPLAGKLKRRSAEEAELSTLIVDGVAALQAGDNPRIIREKLGGYVAPSAGKKGAKAEGGDGGAAGQAKAA